jgi:hypothetical protein
LKDIAKIKKHIKKRAFLFLFAECFSDL